MAKIIEFIREVVVEFKNISWPKKDALIQLTIVVISISLIVSLILGGFDYLFTYSFSLLGKSNPPSTNIITPSLSPSPTVIVTPTTKSKK